MRKLILFSSLLVLFGCSTPTVDEQILQWLENTIGEASRNRSAVQLSKLENIEWDNAVVFGPYTPLLSMPSNIQSDPRVITSDINLRDDISLIVFLASHKIVGVVSMRRSVLDFSSVTEKILLPSDCVLISSDSPPKASISKDCNKL